MVDKRELDDIDPGKLLTDISNHLERRPLLSFPFITRGRLILTLMPLMLGILGLLIILLPWKPADTIAYSLLTLAGWWFVPVLTGIEVKLLYRLFVSHDRFYLLKTFIAKDRLGKLELKGRLLRILSVLAEREEFSNGLLAGQPPEILIECMLSQNQSLRREAALRLPADISAADVEKLAIGNYEECRLAAAAHPACPLPKKLGLCDDQSSKVRQEAIAHLPELSPEEAVQLSKSRFPETRSAAIDFLPRKQLVQLAVHDRDINVRQKSITRLGTLSGEESVQFAASGYADIRQFAVRQEGISREQLKQLAAKDTSKDVRQAACQRLGDSLSPGEVRQLIESGYTDTRQAAIEGAENSAIESELRSLFFDLCRDREAAIAGTAFKRLAGTISTGELISIKEFNTVLWEPIVCHPHAPAELAVQLMNKHVKKSKYIKDSPEEGHYEERGEYDSYNNYSTYTEWVVDSPERGHYEYDIKDIDQAKRVIDSVPKRREEVLQHLQQKNKELYDLVK